MTPTIAREHIKDGADCISEAMRSLKRVRKNFPESNDALSRVEAHLKLAQEILSGPIVLGGESQPA